MTNAERKEARARKRTLLQRGMEGSRWGIDERKEHDGRASGSRVRGGREHAQAGRDRIDVWGGTKQIGLATTVNCMEGHGLQLSGARDLEIAMRGLEGEAAVCQAWRTAAQR